MNKIEKITLKIEVDDNPDLSYLGEYSDTPAERHIDRQERGDKEDGEYRYFNLGYGDPEYLEQDYERAEAYNRGEWYMFGIIAKVEVSYERDDYKRLETLSSGGLWGIESDSGTYIREAAKQQLAELEEHLKRFNVDLGNFEKLADKALEDFERGIK